MSQEDPTPPLLEHISQQIAHHTSLITSALHSHNLPHPTFSASSPLTFPPSDSPPQIHVSRMALVQLCQDLTNLILGPVDALLYPIVSMKVDVAVLRTLNSFGIPEAVPLEGETGYKEVGEKVGLDEDIVKRVIRYCAAQRIFSVSHGEKESVRHTAKSRALAQHEKLRGALRHNLDDIFPAFLCLPEALRRFPCSQEPSESPFSYAYGTEKGWFEWMTSPGQEQSLQSYHQTLSFLRHGPFDPARAASAPVFRALGPGSVVVDVGGSTGHVSIALGEKLSYPRFIVQDLQSTIAQVRRESPPKEVEGRISFSAHDFFTPQNTPADVYLLRFVLHDWPDKYCRKILSNLLPQLQQNPQARIVILEAMLPSPGTLPMGLERMGWSADLQMLGYANARERDRGMWEALVRSTDERLSILDVYQPLGCVYGVIEVGLIEEQWVEKT